MSTVPEILLSLQKHLVAGDYECSVCADFVDARHSRWSCKRCFGVFHLKCIHFWCSSQIDQLTAERRQGELTDKGVRQFRCPLCQQKNAAVEDCYRCFCEKTTDPAYDPMLTPGSCGQTCGRRRADPSCQHTCTMLCHPGPCPECTLTRTQGCFCGANERNVGCSSGIDGFECGEECGKELNCGRHYCKKVCHRGPCGDCQEFRELKCFCGETSEWRACTSSAGFTCGKPCGRKLSCGVHVCAQRCHGGPCAPCERSPAVQSTCACGSVPLWKLHHGQKDLPSRLSCVDPIPTCGKDCNRPLRCGTHMCKHACHDTPTDDAIQSLLAVAHSSDECPPCTEIVTLRCACGYVAKKSQPCFVSYLPKTTWLPVAQACRLPADIIKGMTREYPIPCDRFCGKMLSCGRHKCENLCCGDDGHICMKLCHKRAGCGIHECGQLCHTGPCPPCQNIGVDPLYCRCGKSVIDPPVPCGSPPPRCNHPCSIQRPCGHPAQHNCHTEGPCPPCTMLVPKTCGSHGVAMPFHQACYISSVSCGKRCGKALTCCGTSCQHVCHSGECVHKCKQRFPSLS